MMTGAMGQAQYSHNVEEKAHRVVVPANAGFDFRVSRRQANQSRGRAAANPRFAGGLSLN
jgi:hypothetical protein